MLKFLAALFLLAGCIFFNGHFDEAFGVRGCFNAQRALAGALEMYSLEKEYNLIAHLMAGDFKPERLRPARRVDPKTSKPEPCPDSPPFVTLLTDEVRDELVRGGYLVKEEISDPGHLFPAGRTLCVGNRGYGVLCLVHGSPPEPRQSTGDSVRWLLTEWGIRDARVLDLAFHEGRCGFCAYHNFPLARIVAGTLLLGLWLLSLRAMRRSPR